MLSKKELEDIRPWVSESVTTFLGFSEDTVVSAALDCVARSLSRQATTGSAVFLFAAHHAHLTRWYGCWMHGLRSVVRIVYLGTIWVQIDHELHVVLEPDGRVWKEGGLVLRVLKQLHVPGYVHLWGTVVVCVTAFVLGRANIVHEMSLILNRVLCWSVRLQLDQLTPFLDNAAPQFVELLYRKVLEVRTVSQSFDK